MNDTEKELTPQEILMQCISDAERIDQIVVLIYTKDKFYETWSNGLPSHVRLGLLREAVIRVESSMQEAESEPL